MILEFGRASEPASRLLRLRAGFAERRRSIQPGWTGKAGRTIISPVAQGAATSKTEMSTIFRGRRRQVKTAVAVTAYSPASFREGLTTISDQLLLKTDD